MEKDLEREAYTLKDDANEGVVSIADDVVAMIAAIAATEVDGVGSLAGNAANDFMSKVGVKKIAKGVKVSVADGKVNVDLAVIIDYGYNIPETCQSVQNKVKTAIESMTGLEVDIINIRIGGINMKD